MSEDEISIQLLLVQYRALRALYELMPDDDAKKQFIYRWNEKHAENFRSFLDWVSERIVR